MLLKVNGVGKARALNIIKFREEERLFDRIQVCDLPNIPLLMHTFTHIYIYIYIYMCVCVCVRNIIYLILYER